MVKSCELNYELVYKSHTPTTQIFPIFKSFLSFNACLASLDYYSIVPVAYKYQGQLEVRAMWLQRMNKIKQ